MSNELTPSIDTADFYDMMVEDSSPVTAYGAK
jgi:hypothetical protein